MTIDPRNDAETAIDFAVRIGRETKETENAAFLARIKRQLERGEISSIVERDRLVEIIEELTRRVEAVTHGDG